ncbi:MAG: TspO/MBR family protein [Bacteroidales bacterium]|nr:TspO/MBR family protein [Bacteroidales bacterium]
MKTADILKLIISIILPLSVGAIAGIFTAQAVPDWYAGLRQPSFNPPKWIFGPVWTTLYIVMGFSFFLIWKMKPTKERNRAILIFLVHLLLNFGWSFFFFYFKMIGIALIEIILLWSTIVLMLFSFYRLKPLAAYLNIPYLLWVTFATALNAAYFFLN